MKKPQSLVAKLCAIMRRVDAVAKRGTNETDGYIYATEGDIKEAFRDELAKRRVFLVPSVLSSERHKITLSLRGGDVDTYITVQRVQWTFFDGDGDAPINCIVEGCGEDQSDKGVYKALTGSLKSLLMSSFLIRSGEDPDADSKTTAKEVREKKLEAAQKVGEAKANGTYKPEESFPLWYVYPEEFNGHYARMFGTDAAFTKYREALMANGKFNLETKTYKIPRAKMDELIYVLSQMGVTVKDVSANA